MHIIAGLGNPGPQYAGNRHNIGFMVADAIVRHHSSFGPWQKKFSAQMSEGRIGGKKVLLLKPLTFMNLSGQSVGEAMRFYKLATEDITVFYDELDLAPGKMRIKRGGGSGGHNGIKSLDAHCGTQYRRVRMGIGHPGDKGRVHAHVLGDFAKADQSWLEPMLDAAAGHLDLLLSGDESSYMNKVAASMPPTRSQSGDSQERGAPSAAQSHIRQARPTKPKSEPSGAMADMLKKLLGN